MARAALQCLSQIFSWIPLSTHVTPHLMELVFRFVAMGTQPCGLPPPAGEAAGGGGVAVPVPVAALAAVNEVLYKNCVPVQFEDFVVLLFNNACIILHHLIDGTKNTHLPQTVHPQYGFAPSEREIRRKKRLAEKLRTNQTGFDAKHPSVKGLNHATTQDFQFDRKNISHRNVKSSVKINIFFYVDMFNQRLQNINSQKFLEQFINFGR